MYASYGIVVLPHQAREICTPDDLHLHIVPVPAERDVELLGGFICSSTALPIKEA